MKGQEPAIDLMLLYTRSDWKLWNRTLWKHYSRGDVSGLVRLRKRMQLGMDKLVKAKLNDEKICIWFIRTQRSIENTIKEILRSKLSNPLDYSDTGNLDPIDVIRAQTDKRARDQEIEKFLRRESY